MPAFTDAEIETALPGPLADPTTEQIRQTMLHAAHTTNQHLQPGYQASMWLAGIANATAWITTPPKAIVNPAPLPMRTGGCCQQQTTTPDLLPGPCAGHDNDLS